MKFYMFIALLFLSQSHLFAQMVSNNNDDDVNKIDTRMSRTACREGEILVKFKPKSAVNVRRRANGKFSTSSVSTVDAVLKDIGVEELEELMPNIGDKQPVNARLKIRDRKMQKAATENLSKLYRVRLSTKNLDLSEPIEKLKALDDVEYAEPNYLVFTTATVDDYQSEPLYAVQWGLNAINLPQLWAVPAITENRPVIAILDTGVDISHPDLEANIWTNAREANGEEGYDNDNNGFKNDVHGWDFINQTGNIADYNGHGTHCAGIAGAVGDNGVGVVGANPDALIMPVTVMQSDGVGDVATIIRGIDYAAANGADVISMSFGSYAASTALEQALGRAYQSAVLVAAAGNDGYCLNHPHIEKGQREPMPMFPAAYTFVLGVQATQNNSAGGLASFSNFDDDGPVFSQYSESQLYNYELSAPGASIMSTFPGGTYRQLNGTSMACPLVAGAISRLLQTKEYPTKEILFGDLINSKNNGNLDIYKAYQIQEADRKPTLDFITYVVDDSGGDNDGRIDAGEIISIYPVLRNEWGTAENIRISIEMGELEDASLIEFITAETDFGTTLSGYGKSTATNGLKFKVSENCVDARHIKLVLKATCDNISSVMQQNITIEVTNAETLSGMIENDMTLTADKVWLVESNLAIPEGVTLRIEPGTRVEFNEGVSITCEGDLDIHGEPGKMIVLTNRAGQGQWKGINVNKRVLNYVYANEERTKVKPFYSEETPQKWQNVRVNNLYFKQPNVYWFTGSYLDLYHSDASLIQQDGYSSINTASSFDIVYIPTFSYCVFDGVYLWGDNLCNYDNCIIKNSIFQKIPNICSSTFYNNQIDYINCLANNSLRNQAFIRYNNIINNSLFNYPTTANEMEWDRYLPNNVFNMIGNGQYISSSDYRAIKTIKSETPSYLGTGKEEIAREHCLEIGRGRKQSNNKIDLSNMLTQPLPEAHGIVWKVVVNGYDAQDEFDELPPLGVGRHKFEVYFNRPMNKEVAPMITMGVREPYTQTTIGEDGEWNEEGTVYTAYLTISGKNVGDGLNRIYVADAQDDEYFEIPLEATRFNVLVQAAGSMSAGFEAVPGLGRVSLEWEAPTEEFDDLLGYNIYRYTLNESGEPADAIKLNSQLLESNETTYVDYDVTPNQTYYYYYKVMTTDLAENDPSKVVAATPLTSALGDANGSGEVDVADVITTVNYAAGLDPKPFIFEAADMNTDSQINVIDVVGIIYKILNPEGEAKMRTEATATFTVEDGVLYVESPVALAGVQVLVNSQEQESPSVLDALNGFEQASAWMTDEDCVFLAYNMAGKTLPAGKTAIMQIGGATLRDIRLSDAYGNNVTALPGNATSIIDMSLSTKQQSTGIYNLNGQKVAGNAEHLNRLPKGVYVVEGQKIVK